MVPLINVVFLLLIFFMLTGTLRRAEPFAVELPGVREGELRPTREARSLSISAQGELALDGRSLTADELASALAADPRDDPLQLRADAHLTARVFVPLLDRLREAGVAQIELVTLDAR